MAISFFLVFVLLIGQRLSGCKKFWLRSFRFDFLLKLKSSLYSKQFFYLFYLKKLKGDRCQMPMNHGEDLCLSNPCWYKKINFYFVKI